MRTKPWTLALSMENVHSVLCSPGWGLIPVWETAPISYICANKCLGKYKQDFITFHVAEHASIAAEGRIYLQEHVDQPVSALHI